LPQLQEQLAKYNPNDKINIEVLRGKNVATYTLQLNE
jgi:hypothetical protein